MYLIWSVLWEGLQLWKRLPQDCGTLSDCPNLVGQPCCWTPMLSPQAWVQTPAHFLRRISNFRLAEDLLPLTSRQDREHFAGSGALTRPHQALWWQHRRHFYCGSFGIDILLLTSKERTVPLGPSSPGLYPGLIAPQVHCANLISNPFSIPRNHFSKTLTYFQWPLASCGT